jgi:pyruvate formate lyase activating enzyme
MTASDHEAMLYSRNDDQSVDCFLCAHRCHIQSGKRGICMVRENREGTLVSLVYVNPTGSLKNLRFYGKLIALNADPIEKKPLYHVQPGSRSMSIATMGCNFKCDFCQNWNISQQDGGTIQGEDTTAEAVVEAAVAHGCKSISYTYTEPTIFFEFAYDCAKLGQARGLRNCFVTNGFQTPETLDKMAGLIDAANVDLKAFNDAFYRDRCKGRLAPVKETIKGMVERGIHVEVTTLLIPGFNDAPDELKAMTEFIADVSRDIPWHVSRYHPDYKFDQAPPTSTDTIYKALELGHAAGLRYLYAGNIPGGQYENTICPQCMEIVIKRSGYQADPVNLSNEGKCVVCGYDMPVLM